MENYEFDLAELGMGDFDPYEFDPERELKPYKPSKSKTKKYILPYNMYAPVDNPIILYSCEKNPYILPLCLFSWAHAVHGYDAYVETNLALIHETLAPTKRASGEYRKIKDALRLLALDGVSSEDEIPWGDSKKIVYAEEYRNIKPTTTLRFFCHVGYGSHEKGFTKIYIDEYYYLLGCSWLWNYYGSVYTPEERLIVDCKTFDVYESKDKSFKTVDVCLLINLYAYLKMRILQYEEKSKKSKNGPYVMREKIETIAKRFGKGNRTIRRHIRFLIDLDMIGINGKPSEQLSGRYIANVLTYYWLNNKWRE